MTSVITKLTYDITAERLDTHGSLVRCKDAVITLDTDLEGRRDAFNPAELLLGALAACILKGIERVAPMLHFQLAAVSIRIHALRQEAPPKLESVRYDITIETEETDQRIALLHSNVQKYGTVFNTVAPGTDLQGTMRRAVVATELAGS